MILTIAIIVAMILPLLLVILDVYFNFNQEQQKK